MQNSLSRKSSTTWKQSTKFSPAEICVSNYQQHGNIQFFFRLQKCLSRKSSLSQKSQRLFRLQICLSRRSSIPRKHSKTFSPAEFSQTQIINNLEIFKDFFTCRIVLAANHQQPGNSQQHFHRQKYLSLKLSATWRHSMFFSPAEISQPQIMIIPKKFKDFFACKLSQPQTIDTPKICKQIFTCRFVLAANKSLSRKHSKIFSPAKLSQPQIIDAPEILKHFFTCRYVLIANHQQLGKIRKLFGLQNSLRRISSTTWKYSKIFQPAYLSWPQIITIPKTFKDFSACRIVLAADHQQPENIQRPFRLQICLCRRSSMPRKYSKTFSPAELSQPQIINNLEIIRNIFACKTVSAANHQYPENIHRFFAFRIVLAADHRYPEIIQRLFHLQNCLSLRSSTTWKKSGTFSPAKLSRPQIINIPKTFLDFFAFRIVLAADHRYLENIQRLFHLQNCLSLRSSTTWKYSNLFHMQNSLSHKSSTTWKQSTKFSPAEISQSQIINNMEIFNVFFACSFVLAENHHYREKIQRFFRLQNCLIRRSSIPRKNSNSFSPADMSQWQSIKNPKIFKDFFVCRIVFAADHRCPGNIQTLFHLQICLGRKSSLSRKHSKIFSPAEFSQTQIINNLEIIKDFFACRFDLAAGHRYPEKIQRFFHLQNCLSRN